MKDFKEVTESKMIIVNDAVSALANFYGFKNFYNENDTDDVLKERFDRTYEKEKPIEVWEMKIKNKSWTMFERYKDCCYASVYGAYRGWFY